MTDDSAAAFHRLVTVLAGGRLTGLIAGLEHELLDADGTTAVAATEDAGIDASLLTAALLVRRDVGRLNDLIHACAITLALPRILEPGEKIVRRPSLGAGNDATRKYDLETDRRVAEFKLAQWAGADAMRKRTLFQDLVHLAAAGTGRRAELYAVGPAPLRFLRTSRSAAAWGLDRSQPLRALFAARFGSLDMPIAEFTAGPAAHVRLIDIAEVLPEVAAAEAGSAAAPGSDSVSTAPTARVTPSSGTGVATSGQTVTDPPADARRNSRDGARQEILAAAHAVVVRAGRAEFTMPEVIAEMQRRGTAYAEATIRTMMSAHLCAEATGDGVAGYADLTRVGRGLYRFAHPPTR